MHPALILLIAIAVVLVGILVFRLHAFVALILAAMVVAVLTPTEQLIAYARQQVESGDWTEQRAEAFVEKDTVGVRVAQGFGRTCTSIGILIAMASIIGKCLLDSGSADRIVRTIIRWVGEARTGIAFVGSGFVLGIPVFFDTVFYLMIPLGKAARMRSGKNYLFYILTIVAGATMAHSLVPPTPGPLIVVERFGVDLITMIIAGCIVGAFASSAGYLFAWWLNQRMEIPLRDAEESNGEERPQGPPFLIALSPIVLPVILIGMGTAVNAIRKASPQEDWPSWFAWADERGVIDVLRTLGDKNVALILAAALSVAILVVSLRCRPRDLADRLQSALASAGIIILITAAGGAFGAAVRQCGIAGEIANLTRDVQPLVLLPLAFLITTLVRTAQGSATVAMITAASVLQDLAHSEALTFNVVYLALAVGCGSKPIAWMADSGFWVICKMSGMTEIEGLKTVTPMSCVMGVAGLVVTMIGAWLVPLN